MPRPNWVESEPHYICWYTFKTRFIETRPNLLFLLPVARLLWPAAHVTKYIYTEKSDAMEIKFFCNPIAFSQVHTIILQITRPDRSCDMCEIFQRSYHSNLNQSRTIISISLNFKCKMIREMGPGVEPGGGRVDQLLNSQYKICMCQSRSTECFVFGQGILKGSRRHLIN